MFTLAGWYESQDGGGAYHHVAAIQDQSLTTENDDIRVPRDLPNIIAKAALSGASTLTAARLESPSLARMIYPNIEPLVNAVVFGDPPQVLCDPDLVTPVAGDEGLRCAINSDHASAVAEYGLVWFADTTPSKAKGAIFSVRATAAITQVAGTWVNGDLTFEQVLPVGDYDVVGMRARSTNMIAARLVFTGYTWRPGVPAVNALGDRDNQNFRLGRMGVFGRFHSTTPPRVDCLGVTDTSESFILDLIKVG